MPIHPELRPARRAAAAMALVFTAAPAWAALVPSGGGDYNQVPLYRALTFGTVNFAGDSIDGIDYVSNVSPMAQARNTTTFQVNGATFQSSGQAAFAGFYAGRNHAQISVTNANAGDQYYQVAGQGSATSVQFFTPEAAAARATFTWQVTGSSSNPSGIGNVGCPQPVPPPGCFPPATGRLDFGASTNQDVNWLHLFADPNDELESITRFGPGTFSYNLPIANLGDVINLFYWSSAYTQVNAGEAPQGSNFQLTADYFNTFLLAEVQLFDENDNPISEWSMVDMNLGEEVFNQDGRVAPVLPPPPEGVPEPASGALLLAAAAATVATRRRSAVISSR